MTDRTAADAFLAKAERSLAGAESEFANQRYDNSVNRAYYACFQAAISALLWEGIRTPGRWGHDVVQARFVGQLINRRKRYGAALRRVLGDNRRLRETADYATDTVSEIEAMRAIRRSRELVLAVRQGSVKP